MKKIRLISCAAFFLVFLLAACSSPTPIPPTEAAGPVEYPAPQALAQAPGGYPPPEGGYPVPEDINSATSGYPDPKALGLSAGEPVNTVKFQLTKPISAGDTQVNGTGPAGIPILLADVTLMGEVVSETNIKEDGTFSFTTPPLEKGHRLGLALADLNGTKWTRAQFVDPSFFGDEAANIPNVGFLYDTAMIEP